jgi:hypothetical protein
MIFNQFDQTDIVAGRTSKVASGFFPDGNTNWSSSYLVDDFWSLTQSLATPSPSYGSSIYDVRRTGYYLNVYPNSSYYTNNDPYFSIAYGNFYGNLGSGSFDLDTGSIHAYYPKTVYTQYKNLLLGSADVDGKFGFKTGSVSTDATPNDIFIINFSSYKFKNVVDAGQFEITLTGSKGQFTFRDDSPFQTQTMNVYNLVSGAINDGTSTIPTYEGIGLLYPSDGIVVFNAEAINRIVGLDAIAGIQGGVSYAVGNYNPRSNATFGGVPTTSNHKTFFWSIQNSNSTMKVRKTEYVPSRHYFIRVKNRDFNYSNNPTYVYDGTEDNIHAKGTIRNEDFISDPRTYVTSVGLYNNNNELVAVAKLSRPALKSFDNELLVKVKLDF